MPLLSSMIFWKYLDGISPPRSRHLRMVDGEISSDRANGRTPRQSMTTIAGLCCIRLDSYGLLQLVAVYLVLTMYASMLTLCMHICNQVKDMSSEKEEYYDALMSDTAKVLLSNPRCLQEFQHHVIMEEISRRFYDQEIAITIHLPHSDDRRFVVERMESTGFDRLKINIMEVT